MNFASDLIMNLGDYTGHVGRHIGGFDGVQGGYAEGQRNLEECYQSFACVCSKYMMNVRGK